jgi:hypothetical protein
MRPISRWDIRLAMALSVLALAGCATVQRTAGLPEVDK